MKIRSLWWAAVLLGTLVAAAPPAIAAGPVKEAKEKLKEEKKELKEARKNDGGVADEKKDVKQAADELREARKKRRQEHLAEMRAKWGEILKKPGVKEEMRVHMRRMSRLRRIEHLAKEGKKDAIAKRAAAAMEKEKARHQKKMDELKGQAAPAASGGAK
ncbi:MAG: hypothetical protein IPF92_16495 [Myxococcales bacterium]|nr:hypothetical protein [Myxococcales bacterium]MBL0195407.1 hypothetical protein [Myxococcales bacterium]HQY59867.1 hypothetical protein [Polyangiaceae bacterium]